MREKPNLSLKRVVLPLLAFVLFAELAKGQTFTDLDFEQATAVLTSAQPEAGYSVQYGVETSAALPGWTVEYGTTPVSVIWGIPSALDQTAVQLVGEKINPMNSNTLRPDSGAALVGKYSVNLYGVNSGSNQDPSVPTVASISQTGEIPVGTKSIQFFISDGGPAYDGLQMQPTVTFNGNAINVWPVFEINGLIEMAGDVSEYAGTTGQLAFSAIPTEFLPGDPGGPNGPKENDYTLDNISFSTESVPEPSSWALGFVAAVTLLGLRRGLKIHRRS